MGRFVKEPNKVIKRINQNNLVDEEKLINGLIK
jgi:hypothetical protein